MSKKKVLASVLVLLMTMNATGCGKKKDQTVSTDGSTSMEKVIGYLSEAYMEENSDAELSADDLIFYGHNTLAIVISRLWAP